MSKSPKKCKRVIGWALDENDINEYQKHLDECEQCRATDALLRVVRKTKNDHGALPPLDDLAVRKFADTVLAGHLGQQLEKSGEAQRKGVMKFRVRFAAAVMIVSALSWFFWTSQANETTPEKAVTAGQSSKQIVGSSFALLSGEVFMGEKPAITDGQVKSGSTVRTLDGRAVISLPYGIAVSMDKDTTLSVKEVKSGRFAVEFSAGSALFALDPRRKRHGFKVITTKGRIIVSGTVFTVESSMENIVVHLLRGSLIIEEENGVQRKILGKQSIILGEQETAPITRQINDQMLSRARELLNMKLGDHLSSLVSPPPGIVRVVEPERQRRNALVNDGTSKPLPTLKALMKKARRHKLESSWRAAAKVYEEVVRRYPASNDARTSYVSMGQLYLEKLKRPRRALRHFTRYLKQDDTGALAQEALYGKARALRKLGQKSDERTVLEELLAKYPKGLYAKLARKRIIALP